MKVTLKPVDKLKEIFGLDSWEVDVSTYEDILSSCINLFPSFSEFINNISSIDFIQLIDGDSIIDKFKLKFPVKSSEIYLVPTVKGGIKVDELNNLVVFYGGDLTATNQEINVTSFQSRVQDSFLFGKATTAFDTIYRKQQGNENTNRGSSDPSTGFGALSLSSAAGTPVPLVFGMHRVPGTIINSYIKHILRLNSDVVRVTDYVL